MWVVQEKQVWSAENSHHNWQDFQNLDVWYHRTPPGGSCHDWKELLWQKKKGFYLVSSRSLMLWLISVNTCFNLYWRLCSLSIVAELHESSGWLWRVAGVTHRAITHQKASWGSSGIWSEITSSGESLSRRHVGGPEGVFVDVRQENVEGILTDYCSFPTSNQCNCLFWSACQYLLLSWYAILPKVFTHPSE